MKYTPALRNFLAHHESNLPPADFFNLKIEIERLLRVWIEKLKQIEPGAERAMIVQEQIDKNNDDAHHLATSCQKGCGFCCHLEVEITLDDSERLAQWIIAKDIRIDQTRLAEQGQRMRMDGAWAKGTVSANRCVLLGDDNACRAYEARPTICRKHSVVSPVSECSTLGGQPIPRLLPMSEIVLSAAVSLVDQETGSLSKMLGAALARKTTSPQIHQLTFLEEEPLDIQERDQKTGPTWNLEGLMKVLLVALMIPLMTACPSQPKATPSPASYAQNSNLLIEASRKLANEPDVSKLHEVTLAMDANRTLACDDYNGECDQFAEFLSRAIKLSEKGNLTPGERAELLDRSVKIKAAVEDGLMKLNK